MKTKTFHRIFAVILSVAMLFSGIGMGSVKSVNAAENTEENKTITLSGKSLYQKQMQDVFDNEGNKIGEKTVYVTATETYDKNTLTTVRLGNASGKQSDNLYIDAGTAVELEYDSELPFYAYFAANEKSNEYLTGIGTYDVNDAVMNGKTLSIDSSVGGSTLYVEPDEEGVPQDESTGVWIANQNVYYTITPIDNKKGKIRIVAREGVVGSTYIHFSGNEVVTDEQGNSSTYTLGYTLTVHVMARTTQFSIEENIYTVRQGRNTNIAVTDGRSLSLPEGTDGYNWYILKGTNYPTNILKKSGYFVDDSEKAMTEEELENVNGTISPPVDGGKTKEQTQPAIFNAYSSRGIGEIYVMAETNSGIDREAENNSCVALLKRKLQSITRMNIKQWDKATAIGFVKNGNEVTEGDVTYNFRVGTTVNLENLIIGHTGKMNGNEEIKSDDYFRYFLNNIEIGDRDRINNSYTFDQPGRFTLKVKSEDESIENSCTVIVSKPTERLVVYQNDIDDSNVVGDSQSVYQSSRTAIVRYNNTIKLIVVEDENADEPLSVRISSSNSSQINDVYEYLSVSEPENPAGNIFVYTFKVIKDVSQVEDFNIDISTSRDAVDDEHAVTNISTSFLLQVFPSAKQDLTVTYLPVLGGYNDVSEYIAGDSFDMYTDENTTVTSYPGDAADGAVDQIIYNVTHNSAYITNTDSSTDLRTTLLELNQGAEDYAVLNATSTSNDSITKDIRVNIKKRVLEITSLRLQNNNSTNPTLSKGESSKLVAVTDPVDADEDLYWESDYPAYVSVDQEGNVEALEVTDDNPLTKNGVRIRVYAMHMHGNTMHKTLYPLASISIKVKETGDVVVDPEDWTETYDNIGRTLQVTVYKAGTGHTEIINDATVNWSVENTDILSLSDSQGSSSTATTSKVGSTRIIATSGGVSGYSSATITAPLNDSHIDVTDINTNMTQNADSYIYLPRGGNHNIVPGLTVRNIDSRGNNYQLNSEGEGVDFVYTDSFVNGLGVGDYSITYKMGSNGLYTGTLNVPYRIFPRSIGDGTDISSDGKITVEQIDSLIYNAAAQKPGLKISYTVDGVTEVLDEGEDYQVDPYFDGSMTDDLVLAGQHKVLVTGLGNFAATEDYPSSFVYEYTIAPYNIQNIGTKSILRKGDLFVTENAIDDQIYTANNITPSVDGLLYAYLNGSDSDPVVMRYDPNSSLTDFDYSYSNNKKAYTNDNPDFGTATLTFEGKNNYTGTVSTTFKILRKDISSDVFVESIPNQVFTGFRIEPDVSVYYGSSAEFSSEELESGKDYEVSYLDNVDSQVVSGKSASVVISGKGNYTGSRTQPFTIEQADLSDSETVIISDIPDQYDCGTFLKPPVSVRYGGYTLIEGEDFTPFYGRDNGTNLEYNYSVGENKGVVAILPVEQGNFRASRPTTICGRFGQEKFFNIVDKTITHKADSITIKRIVSDPNESTDLIKPNTIFVNAVGGVTENTTVQFEIEAICSTGECDDPIFVTVPDEDLGKFNCSVETLDFVQGNKAVLTVTGGPGAATGKIYLATKGGYNMAVAVVVNDPATNVQLVYDTNKTDMRNVISNISNGVTSVREKHDFYLIANLSRGNRDEVIWESDNESVATVDVTGKVTAHGQGKATISATTKASELFDGGVKGYITMNVFGNVMAETLSIEPEISQIRTGRIMQLNGSAVGENGSVVTENLVWKSDNENIVEIIDGRETSAVTIEAKSPGTTTLHYGSEFEDGNEATLEITVYDPSISVSIREFLSKDADDIGMINGVVNTPINVFGVVVDEDLDKLKDDAKVEWTPGNEDILTVEYNNENNTSVNLLFHKVGTTTLTVESGGETALYNVTVTAPLNGANGPDDPYVSVSDVEDCTYLPNGLVPTFEEKAISSVDSRGAQYKLEKAKDYVISNNYPKGGAVGNYVYTLSKAVNGLYTDSLDIPYSVLAKSIGVGDEPDAEITVEQKDSLTYNASPQIPDLKISYTVGDETEVLAKNAYQIDPYYDGYSMDNLTSAGQHKVLVSGLGNYTGSFVYEYTIAPYNIQEIGKNSILRKDGSYVTKDAIPDQTYTAKEITPSVDWLLFAFINGSNSEPVVMNYNPDSSITDFEYSYSDNVNAFSEDNSRFGTATITFVGKNNYTGTVSTTFKIVKKDISTEIYIPEIPVQAYTGFEIEPEVSAYYGSSDTYYNEKLESGEDFTVSFEDNKLSTEVSRKNATVTITGKRNYTGTTTRQFVIGQADLSDPDVVTIDSIPDQYDCGTLLTPPITVRMGEYTLVKDVDYLVSYGNGIDKKYNVSQGTNAGVVTITPVPGGNFMAIKNMTTVRGVLGQEAFFNIVTNSAAVKADAITITQENGDALINGKIYVNKEKNGFSDNTTLKFKIKSVMNDGSESNDAVYAYADEGTERFFEYSVKNLNSDTSGNEAELTITGREAGTAQIKLRTKKGTAKNVDVIILEPASDIRIIMDNKEVSNGDQYMLRENHDYNLEAVFDSGSVTDTVTWSVDDESIAVINEEGKLTTLTTGSIRVFAETNPSLLYPGGIKAVANFNIEENNLAENVVIRNGYDVISKLDLQLDGTITLTGVATRTFGEVTEQLEWTSSDENVISIIDGRTTGTATIKAVGPGTATISYGSKLDENEGGVRASCEVSVLVPVTQVGLSSNSLTVEQGGTVDLKATFNEYAADEFIWTSSNPEAVTISGTSTESANSQTVTLNGLKAGAESTITVVSRTNPSALATCKVQVVDKNAEYVDIEAINATILNGEITIKTGDYLSLKGISSNSSGTISEALKWKSSNNGILRIIGSDSSSEVKLNALSSGTVTVTYGSTKEGGVTASVTVHIVDSVMYINVDKTEVNLSEGEKTTITASFNDKATGQFDWKADDTSVVKIEGASGNITNSETVTVTGLTPGKQTKITVSSKDDANISETIIVKIAENMAESVTLDKTSAEVIKGNTLTLKGTATRSKGVITEALEWKTSNPNVIKITSGQGTDTAVFTAVAAGEATITYGSKISGGKIAECKVTVKNAESSTQSGTEDKPSGGDDKPSGGNDDSSADEGKVGSTKTIGDNTYTVKSENELVFTSVSDSATKVVIPAEVTINGKSYKVTEIAKNAFAGNSKLKSVTIGSNVETIGDNAFKNCKSLTKIVIPSKVKTIGKNAFAGCKKLKTITIKSKKLTKIGKKAFKTIKKGATFKCPKAKKSKYKKLLKKSGLPKKAKVK
ncbi:MAG: Ig-like domain-containing protein [Eubacterium sp.]|nr:Ig-like domain-containing protein [Eubacterium sp.]